ncbi:hypothetical protein CORC01_04902 [Colletotrichum orchidophilum]|uniref:Uncharacterized protein n=1 Tax=Colletotrichum orchidophilum TaxID=1209926 RepID=A0A1G4BEK9_9PEZI|nr:uncharacterized protein CORC01_04902 [Colletotrichum orchidophilum]OHE99766.1 hypothetical protein CORC01_04902 [Colletotrichum orchidophilum]
MPGSSEEVLESEGLEDTGFILCADESLETALVSAVVESVPVDVEVPEDDEMRVEEDSMLSERLLRMLGSAVEETTESDGAGTSVLAKLDEGPFWIESSELGDVLAVASDEVELCDPDPLEEEKEEAVVSLKISRTEESEVLGLVDGVEGVLAAVEETVDSTDTSTVAERERPPLLAEKAASDVDNEVAVESIELIRFGSAVIEIDVLSKDGGGVFELMAPELVLWDEDAVGATEPERMGLNDELLDSETEFDVRAASVTVVAVAVLAVDEAVKLLSEVACG